MDILNFENMGALEIAMIVIATVIVCIVLYFQIASFNETAAKIKQLASFFPHADAYKKIDTSITKSILDSKAELHKFIINPPAKHIPTPVVITPPMNHIDTISEVQPSIVLPIKCSYRPYIMVSNDISVIVSPANVMNLSGAVENDVMPSIENESIYFRGYFDSPAVRAVRL